MPPKTKRQTASSHDKRHENGLANPGRRIAKARSNGNLNGHANGTAPVSSSAQLLNGHDNHTSATATTTGATASPVNGLTHRPHSGDLTPPRPTQATGNTHDDTSHEYGRYAADGWSPSPLPSGAPDDFTASPSPHNFSLNSPNDDSTSTRWAVSFYTSTILSLTPLRDVLAFLLLLLQLPAWGLGVVYVAFAALMLTPHSATRSLAFFTSLSSFTSSHEWLHSTGGHPSLFTTVVSDMIALVLWLVLPVGQDLTLDLALGVVAITLSGAVASRPGSTSSMVLCSSIISICHVFRYPAPRQHGMRLMWTILARSPISTLITASPPVPSGYKYIAHSWPRTLLELHILTQGVVKIVRRHFSEPRGKVVDTDSSLVPHWSSSSTSIDITTESARTMSADGRPPGPPPVMRESREKWSTGKRRRKQATHVRTQQPFWAVVANAKISLTRNIEPTSASTDSFEAHVNASGNLGDAHLILRDDRIWVQQVDPCEVYAIGLLQQRSPYKNHTNEESGDEDLEDEFDPISVRVNGAMWASVRCDVQIADGSCDVPDGVDRIWSAKIFGLTDATNYVIDFLRDHDGAVLYSASIVTPPAASTEVAGIATSAAQSLRPSSPTTTLRNSIVGADNSMAEHRQRAKGQKREHKQAMGNVKREVDIMSHRLASAGSTDEKQKQRQMQLHQAIRQAEDTTTAMSSQLVDLGEVPSDVLEVNAQSKIRWDQARAEFTAAQGRCDEQRNEADRQVNAAKGDSTGATQKRERLAARLAKLSQQHDQSISEQTARSKRDQDRAARINELRIRQQWFGDQTRTMRQQIDSGNTAVYALQQQGSIYQTTLHHAAQQQQQQQQQHAMSSIPESSASPPAPSFTASAIPHHADFVPGMPLSRSRASSIRNVNGIPTTVPSQVTRERPSSMLSNVSGLTDEATGASHTYSNGDHIYQAPGAFHPEWEREYDFERPGSDGGINHSSTWPMSHQSISQHFPAHSTFPAPLASIPGQQQHRRSGSRAGSRTGSRNGSGSGPAGSNSPVQRGSPRPSPASASGSPANVNLANAAAIANATASARASPATTDSSARGSPVAGVSGAGTSIGRASPRAR